VLFFISLTEAVVKLHLSINQHYLKSIGNYILERKTLFGAEWKGKEGNDS